MGLKDAESAAISKAAVWWAKDFIRRAEAGEKGPEMQESVLWIKANKVALSFMLGAPLAVMVTLNAEHIGGGGMHIAVLTLGALIAWLNGAGLVKSDSFHKEALEDFRAVKAIEEAGK